MTVGVVGLVIGTVAGVLLGTRFTTLWWQDFSLPVYAASGNQAYTVLAFLDANQVPRLRDTMEAEIDHTLDFLELKRADKTLRTDSPAWKVYERLKRYRESHAARSVPVPASEPVARQGAAK